MDILNQANIFYFSIKTAMNSFFLIRHFTMRRKIINLYNDKQECDIIVRASFVRGKILKGLKAANRHFSVERVIGKGKQAGGQDG